MVGDHFDQVGEPITGPEVNLTGDWDQSYLDDLNRAPLPNHAVLPEPAAPDGPLTLTDAATVNVDAGAPQGADSTIAIDERALDSFFSERDLTEERGAGRFRRRH